MSEHGVVLVICERQSKCEGGSKQEKRVIYTSKRRDPLCYLKEKPIITQGFSIWERVFEGFFKERAREYFSTREGF